VRSGTIRSGYFLRLFVLFVANPSASEERPMTMPIFSNPAGFWALLGVPAVVAVHFLQQRSRTHVTSTLFLLDALAPESRGGRHWEALRMSRAFWCQIFGVLVATWVLVGPRWVREESAQTVVAVLDSAARMGAFRTEAQRALADKLAASAGRATHTEWVVMTSDTRTPPLYRGPDRAAALAAAAAWQPMLGTHDRAPALRLAHALAGPGGLVWFVTDTTEHVPPGQAAVGVGRALPNVGFAGATVARDGAGHTWRALVKNYAATPQRREWWIEANGAASAKQTVELPPGALAEIEGRFPPGEDACTVVLAGDEFTPDDRLPLVRPVPKQLPASVALDGEAGEFFKKLLGDIEGVTPASGTLAAKLRVERWPAGGPPAAGAAIVLAPAAPPGTEKKGVLTPVTAEKHALVADLNWQGWLGTGPGALPRGPGDTALLWQGETALAWLRPGAEDARQLALNFDWAASNVGRLPATVLLARRFIEAARDAQPGAVAANFDAGAPVALAARDRAGLEPLAVEFSPSADGARAAGAGPLAARTRVVPAAEVAVLRAPEEAGFFTVRRGETVLVRGAAQFADARQGDFRDAATFDTGLPPEAAAALERNTRPDPLTAVWLAALGALLLGSWWPGRRGA
jgi:hypothetical protein